MAKLSSEFCSSDRPWFGSQFSALRPDRKITHRKNIKAGMDVNQNGQLEIEFSELGPWIRSLVDDKGKVSLSDPDINREESLFCNVEHVMTPLTLNIVIQAIGCFEDVQPLVAIGKSLKSQGHRVRFATHLPFRVIIQEHELEFFSIGNVPTELNFLNAEPQKKRSYLHIPRRCSSAKRQREMHSILEGCWRSCYEMGDGTGLHHVPSDLWSEIHEYYRKPFVADAIISNSVTLAPLCCAEALNIPLNMAFTSPCFPTNAFSHPLTSVHPKSEEISSSHQVSYAIMDMLLWSEFGDLINGHRKHLGLEPFNMSQACTSFYLRSISQTCLWSPFLLQKPNDWLDNIEVTGFTDIENVPYDPPKELRLFLKNGPPPLFIGLRKYLTNSNPSLLVTIIEAIRHCGQRAVLETGPFFTIESKAIPQSIFITESCSHRWLFQYVSCVINHGDASEISNGLAMGRPIITVPSRGNQFFWGGVVHRKGVGPAPIPLRTLSSQKLSKEIQEALCPRLLERAAATGNRIISEAGMKNASIHFHKLLNMEKMRCWICPSRAAVWRVRNTEILLSALAGAVLVYAGLIEPRDVANCRNKNYKMRRSPLGSRFVKSNMLIRPRGIRSRRSFEKKRILPRHNEKFQWACIFNRWVSGLHPVSKGHQDARRKYFRHFRLQRVSFGFNGHRHTHQRMRYTALPRTNDTAGVLFHSIDHDVVGIRAKSISAAGRIRDSASIGTFKQAVAKYNVDNPKPGFQAAVNRLNYYTKSSMRRALGQIALPPTEASLRLFCGLRKFSKRSVNNMKQLLAQEQSDITISNQVSESSSSAPGQSTTKGFSGAGSCCFRESKRYIQNPVSAICNVIEHHIMNLRRTFISSGSGTTTQENVLVSLMKMGVYEMCMATEEEKDMITRRWGDLQHSCH